MQLLKTANSNGELVYAIRHFKTFYIGTGVRLLKRLLRENGHQIQNQHPKISHGHLFSDLFQNLSKPV